MVVFTSDHGDYLGDHWLGEKDFFHDCTVKVPLIVAESVGAMSVTVAVAALVAEVPLPSPSVEVAMTRS